MGTSVWSPGCSGALDDPDDEAKLARIINAAEPRFGGLSLGANNRNTFNTAILAAIELGAELQIPSAPGSAFEADYINIPGSVTIRGQDSRNCVLKQLGGSNQPFITGAKDVVGDVRIYNLTIDGNRSGNTSNGYGIYLPDSTITDASIFYGFGICLFNVIIQNCREWAMFVGKNRNMGHVENTEFKRGNGCVYMDSSSDWRFFHPRLAFPLAGHALHINSGADNAFIGGSAYGALDGYECVKIQSSGSQPTKLIGMTVNANEYGGIWVKGPNGVARHMGVIIEGCWFDDNSRAAANTYSHIKMEDTQGNSVVGNTFRYVGGGIQSKYLVDFVGTTGPIEWVGNAFDATVNIPYGTAISNIPASLRSNVQSLVAEDLAAFGGPVGASNFQVAKAAAGTVNWLQPIGSTAGNPVSFGPQGSDLNIVHRITSKGISGIELNPGSVRAVRVNHVASGVNYHDVYSGAAGSPPKTIAAGTDTNIDYMVEPKGTGCFRQPIATVREFADDTAAAAGGIPIGGYYRTASAVKVRVS